ncbi:conserved hypothetical protein [Tenacibaculum sp. 190524A05c]|uniref:hypothetical protein n=1 Tax=Tenacibaculum platacis TaxID=3137852 RepID=UPI0031FA87F3
MQKCLYFICPTDALESVINNSFNSENYYYTSLGNSINLNDRVIASLEDLIVDKRISEISIIIANDNRIIRDAVEDKSFSEINGLDGFYETIEIQRNFLNVFWQINKGKDTLLNNFIRNKIKEIQDVLNKLFLNPVKVSGKIYQKRESIFTDIKLDIPHDFFSLN